MGDTGGFGACAKRVLKSTITTGLIGVFLAQQAMACAFHSYTPDPTLVDYLLASEHVVLTRVDPNNANQFKPVEALIGSIDGVFIPQQVDAKTRQRLDTGQRATVLFARDGAYGPWMQLAVLDDSYLRTINTVLRHRDRWIMEGDAERYQLFADQLNSKNPDLRRLALLELDRADYGLLRDLDLPRLRGIETSLTQSDKDLRPILVLLAGLSGKKALLKPLRVQMEQAAEMDLPYLGAYAMALIELGGKAALVEVVGYAAGAKSLPVATRERLVEAVAIQGINGVAPVQNATEQAVISLLQSSPELAAAVARQFGTRADWRFGPALKQAVAQQPPSNITDIFAVNQYIGIAAEAQKQGG